MYMEIFNLSEVARSFATRMIGQKTAECVGELIHTRKPETIVINWDGVRAASPSFIDEFVGGVDGAMNKSRYAAPWFSCKRIRD